MTSFRVDYRNLGKLPLELTADGANFILTADMVYNIGSDEMPVLITVPTGFETDLASIPAAAGLVGFKKLGRHSWAAILHDFMFVTNVFSYEVANAIFYQELRRSGVNHFKAVLMACAVQFGGKRFYQNSTHRWRHSSQLGTEQQ